MRTVTLREIAKLVGYSRNTVSLALRRSPLVPPATTALIRQAADRLGYQPNPLISHVMAHIRRDPIVRLKAKIALINAHRNPEAFQTHATIPSYVAGCERRARQFGYGFDKFWLHDPKLKANSLIRILRARGIGGILIVGLMEENRLPEKFAPIWENFPSIVTGVRTFDPALSFSCVDHHDLTKRAFAQARALGYKRPALVIDDRIDRLLQRRFTGAMLAAQQELPHQQRIPAFKRIDLAHTELKLFQTWLDAHQPDVVLTLYNVVLHWLKELGRHVPRDIGVIQLEWRERQPEIAGMNQHNDLVGEAALDMLLWQIQRNESGPPASPRATMIEATWMDGDSVRRRTSCQGG